jgi:hypothetical protein
MREAVMRSLRIDDDVFVAPRDRRHQADKNRNENNFHMTMALDTAG